jgi:hypothetical protein
MMLPMRCTGRHRLTFRNTGALGSVASAAPVALQSR